MRRGDVSALGPPRRAGREQQGPRFGVVVQADALLPRSVVLIAPTSRSARPATFRPEVVIEIETTRVLVEQVGAVHVNRLGDHVGLLSPEEMWGIELVNHPIPAWVYKVDSTMYREPSTESPVRTAITVGPQRVKAVDEHN